MAFEPDGGTKNSLFFLPKRCERDAEGRLCGPCTAKAAATAAIIEKKAGKYIANQQTLFHGFVGEMPPLWSHVYMSQWYVDYVAAHRKRLSVETELRAAEAFKACPGPVPSQALTCSEESKKMPRAKTKAKAEPTEKPTEKEKPAEPVVQETPEKKPAKPRAKKPVTPKVIEALQEGAPTEPVSAPVSAPLPPAEPPAPAAKKPRAPKKVGTKADPTPAQPPIGLVADSAPADLRVVEIKVRRATVDGRQVYLSQQKDKVYDMKFNYLGRYNSREDKIVTGYPDSDLE
jgi:hypothetical protein